MLAASDPAEIEQVIGRSPRPDVTVASKRIAAVVGTRPEAIKMAPVILALESMQGFSVDVCATAQHRQLLDQTLQLFDIMPRFDLNVMRQQQLLPDLTARILQGMSTILSQNHYDMLLVQGDTTTAFAAAMAAFYANVPVGHIEAGLRSGEKRFPYPEEMNRRLVSTMADIHFAPTKSSRDNLLREGADASQVHVTGNTVIDALDWIISRIHTDRFPEVRALQLQLEPVIGDNTVILVTAHRRESFGNPIREICHAILDLAQQHRNCHFVYPVHPNSEIRVPVNRLLTGVKNIHLIEPLAYPAFVWLMSRSAIILTDSGGVQEEGPSLGKPVLIMRDTTERTEGIKAGLAFLIGRDRKRIVQTVTETLASQLHPSDGGRVSPYGSGTAGSLICRIIADRLSDKTSPSAIKSDSAHNSRNEESREVFLQVP